MVQLRQCCEIVDNVVNRTLVAAEDPFLSSTAASSCHDGDGASTDVSLIGSHIQSNRGRKRRRENAWKCNIAKARYSHYCRKNTKKQYLGADLNLHTLYYLYKEKAETDGRKPASLSSYKNVFYNEFNLGFHKRLKDGCDYCVAYDNMSAEEKLRKKGESEVHRNLKEQPRLYRDRCKEMVTLNNDNQAAVFDLEDVLATPKAIGKNVIIPEKICTYNLTVYEYGSKQGICNTWHE
ncbi:tRNA uridine 5-carboxymethylaminomethyl modification enzyme mnmg [Plakobranchus ocellatus]|uniref:tRNA uridine 5-carboxymethylaminomethyl modification enzyme mnmg n=1 Tax=Plakobranchus ocellatus TaxID=259542 RepID=A0AAV4CLL9_9GAST|nr:tRNA uridine 5-carboxymethylaminomethyl modification enzyme mnmg [Plakobranchus ocellatus]